MIFAWIYDGVKKKQGNRWADGTTAAPGTSSDRPTIPAQEAIPLKPAKAAPKTADAAQPKKAAVASVCAENGGKDRIGIHGR